MKQLKNKSICLALICLISAAALSQGLQRDIDFWRPPDQRGVNMFEAGKKSLDSLNFEGLRVRVGGAFALQFQGVDHSNAAVPVFPDVSDPTFNANQLEAIGNNFNLATANLDIDVALATVNGTVHLALGQVANDNDGTVVALS